MSSATTGNRTSSCLEACYTAGMMSPSILALHSLTLGDDGGLDVLVLMDAPMHVGCLIDVRIIASSQRNRSTRGTKETDDRLLGCDPFLQSPRHGVH
jgi:hypothetical protein